MSSQTLNISLPKELVKRTDVAAKKLYKSRSEFIRDLIVSELKEDSEWEEIFKAGEEAGRKAGITSEEQVYDMMYELRHGKKSPTSRNR
jgi:metal-responsive CopG/Arc/MetJ family transcriptional regulator